MGYIHGKPPFDLVRLIDIPKENWIGLPVFMPTGGEGVWLNHDYIVVDDERQRRIKTDYDVGVIIKVEFNEALDIDDVYFLGSDGSVLRYCSVFFFTINPDNKSVEDYEQSSYSFIEETDPLGCVSCGAKELSHFDNETHSVEYKGATVFVEGLNGWRCNACEEVVFENESAYLYCEAGDKLILADRQDLVKHKNKS